jgi:ATP-binding protein involved in chromosome partitioning
MSMGFLLPKPALAESQSGSQTDDNDDGRQDAPVVWRGLMVQKAVQQLLFDVDWRAGAASGCKNCAV